jgi:hypothetical protein
MIPLAGKLHIVVLRLGEEDQVLILLQRPEGLAETATEL